MSAGPDLATLRNDAERGIPAALYNLGVWHLGPEGDRDYDAARDAFERAAGQAFAPAQSALGYMFLRAQGVGYDATRAAELFGAAAAQDFPEAIFRRAEMLTTGYGLAADPTAGVAEYRRAAEAGHPGAAAQLAYCTDHGIGTPADPVAATALYLAAARGGDPRAFCAVGLRVERGHTLAPDPTAALAWYDTAAARGYPGAELARRELLGRHPGLTATGRPPVDPGAPSDNHLAPWPRPEPEVAAWSPRVFVFRHFIAPDERWHLVSMAAPFLRRSRVLQKGTGQVVEDEARRSGGMQFVDPLRDPVVRHLEERLARWSHLPPANGEPLTVLRYEPGDEYLPHYDYFDPAVPGRNAGLARGGQRVATFMMYLSDVAAGGETVFPEADITVPPVPGNAVLFHSVHPDGSLDPLSLHAGAAVSDGVKWLATRWLREQAYPLDA